MPKKLFSITKRKTKIMLLDDEEKLLEALSKYLKCKNFDVLTANSINSALSILENVSPDIFIVDVMMPTKTGYDFITSLKYSKKLKNIPFIFLTAKGMTQDRIKGYRLGCEGYVTKPFDPEELVLVIKNIISKNKNFTNIKKIKCEVKKIRSILEKKYNIYIKFTPREKSILLEVIKGLSNKDIATKIQISLRNVEKYITRLLYKTESKNRTELIKFSYKFYKELTANDGNRTRE